MDMAVDARKPFVALNDSGGARIQEGITSLNGYSGIFYRNTIASGYIPQIAAIMGPTAGGAVYSPALTDWVFMVKNTSYMYLTGPDVVKAVIAEEVSHEDLGGPIAHATKSGVCHFVTENDDDCICKVKTLLSYLPDSCHSPLPIISCTDRADRECPELDTIMPDKANRGYDMKKVIASVADNQEMFEPHELWAKNMVVAFIRIMGRPVGVIANNPRFGAGVLDVNASDKAARFIRFCDAFNIPILTFTDVPGYIPGTQQEWSGNHPAWGQAAARLLGGHGHKDQCRYPQGLRRRLQRDVLQGHRRRLCDGMAVRADRRHGRGRGLQRHLSAGDIGRF